MSVKPLGRPGGIVLSAQQRSALHGRLERAVAHARRRGHALAALTVRLGAATDPSALVLASRRAGEPYFCFEEPDRDSAALAALGCVHALEARGRRRFTEVAQRWRALVASAQADPPDGPPGPGLVAVGGFAFAADGAAAPPRGRHPPPAPHPP